MERRLQQIPNLAAAIPEFTRARLLQPESFIQYFSVPLLARGQVSGVLELYHRHDLRRNEDWFEFLNTLAGQVAIAIESIRLFESLERSNVELALAYDATIEGWSRALDLRDKETEGHSQRVTDMTMQLARSLGLSERELVYVRRGALLHDIGKMGVPDSILLKEGPLTESEWISMKRHPALAYEMLSPIRYMRPALDIPYCHHEKWDGTGYPRQLRGEQIPVAARLFAIVDVWDALRSDRTYRKAWAEEKVIAHIRELKGTHFEPAMVDAFLELLASNEREGSTPLLRN
jgi:putative nucleotidyltransferase with HDIG domain